MKVKPSAHWLTFLWAVAADAKDQLESVAKLASGAGAIAFELIYHVLNGLSAKDTADALKKGGIKEAIMCMFYPDGDGADPPMGDPLSDDDGLFRKAIQTFRDVVAFVVALRAEGILIDLIVGPVCFVLGKDYNLPQETLRARIKKFFDAVEDALEEAGLRVGIEFLREVEDRVIGSMDELNLVLDEVDNKRVGAHVDTYHAQNRGQSVAGSIALAGDRLFHLHLNGSDRMPPGHSHDTIKWADIVDAIPPEYEGYAGYEPFCQEVRDNNAALGAGLPDAVEEPGGLDLFVSTLTMAGVLTN